MRKLNKKGFSMVELLATIVILGILATVSIAAIQGIISKAKERYYKTQENNMIAAARSYYEKNSEQAPKVNGTIGKVELKTLNNEKYIDQVKDYYKKACSMDDSYVKVFKYEDEYIYTAYLDCPNYQSNSDSENSNFNNNIEYLGKIPTAKAKIKVSDSTYGIVSYYYRIYSNDKLVYSSEVFSLKGSKQETTKTIKLTSYVPGMIKIKLTTINTQGISKTISEKSIDPSVVLPSGENGSLYEDYNGPKCIIKAEDEESNTRPWASERTIVVGCDDENGVGCVRNEYIKEYKTDKDKDGIVIEDKSGNKTTCNVNVRVDNSPPEVVLKAYKRKADGTKENDTVISQIKTTKTSPTVDFIINKNVVNGWLNKENYPDGVVLEASYSDTSKVKKVTWNWNDRELAKDSIYIKTLSDKNKREEDPNTTSGKFTFSLSSEGYRYGELEVIDNTGKKSKINITVPIDTVEPSCGDNNGSTRWTRDDRDLYLACDDSTSKCKQEKYTKLYNYSKKTEDITFEDEAGNKKLCSLDVYVDKDAPTEPTSGSAGKKNGTEKNVDIEKASGSEDSHSGVKDYYYCIKTDNTTPGKDDSCFSTSNTSFERACSRTTKVYVVVEDNVGNRTDVKYLGKISDGKNKETVSECSSWCGEGYITKKNSCGLYGTTKTKCSKLDKCPKKNTCNCSVRGKTKYDTAVWGKQHCPHKKKHNQGYIHYCICWDGSLRVHSKAEKKLSKLETTVDSKKNTFQYYCPTSPPGVDVKLDD